MIFRHHPRTVAALFLFLGVACSSTSEGPTGGSDDLGSERGGAGGGDATGLGGQQRAGSASGNAGGGKATGGTTHSAGSSTTGGSSGTGGHAGTKSSTGEGGMVGSGGAKAIGGAMGVGGVGRADAGSPDGRASGSGGWTGLGGTEGNGGTSGPREDAGGKETGSGGGDPGTFAPCPASGACKILPLGDSITWGVNYDGGYRVKVFADAIADKKSITYVGKLSNGPSTVSGATFPQNNEGHNGWTIQQLDDIVTGASTDANYKGKKMMVDQAPNIVLLHAGTNDTSRSPSGMPDRLGTLIDHIIENSPDVLLVVTTIIPIKQGSYGSVGETFNKAIPDVVQKRIDAGKHVVLVDMFKNFPSGGLGSDGVHPNQQGYEWMAGIWYDAIKGYLH